MYCFFPAFIKLRPFIDIIILNKSNLITLIITLILLIITPKRVTSDGAHLRTLAYKQYSSEEHRSGYE